MSNSQRFQFTADRMIKRWGGQGFLIRAGVRRSCKVVRAEYKPSERGLFLDGSERFFISAVALTIPPDHEQDILEFKGKALRARQYKIILPPSGPRPDGTVVFYDCNCMFVKEV